VGTVSYDLTDFARPDPYAQVLGNPPGPRALRVQLWYPAEDIDPGARPLPWMVDGLRQVQAIVDTHGFPSFIWNHTVLMNSNSYAVGPDLELLGAQGPWPVVLISHGWEGYRGLHADLAEELASHGYLVAALEHTYGAAATLLDDGRLRQSSPVVLPARGSSDQFPVLATRLVQTFADDNRFLLQHLTSVQEGRADQGPSVLGQLAGTMDLSQVGLVGHSTGGGAMVRLVLDLVDQPLPGVSVAGLVGLDAWVEPIGEEALASGSYTIPSLFLRSEQWEGGINDGYLVPFVDSLGTTAELEQIEGITHQQFSTLYMYVPVVQWLGMLGTADPWEFRDYLRQRVREFF